MTLLLQACAALAAIAAGVVAVGVLYRRIAGGVRLAELVQSLPKRLDSIDGKIEGLHSRMGAAETVHDETLAEVRTLAEKVEKHLTWSEQETDRRRDAESRLWEALDQRPDDS